MTARNVGGTTDRNSLSTRQANGAAVLVEVDAAAVAVLLLVSSYERGQGKFGHGKMLNTQDFETKRKKNQNAPFKRVEGT